MRLDNLIAPKRWPWCDRGGRFSALRAGAFAIAVAPALWIALALAAGWIAADPLKQATHLRGTWTLYSTLGPLAMTPPMLPLTVSRLSTLPRLPVVPPLASL